jgi:CDP-diglyceride synthetase
MDDNPDFLKLTSEDTESEATPASTANVGLEGEVNKPIVTFWGNSYDLAAVVGVTAGILILINCATCNYGMFCLPLVPVILGIIGLVAAKDAVEAERTKLLSWFSFGTGALIYLLIFLAVAAYIAFFIVMFIAAAADSGGF